MTFRPPFETGDVRHGGRELQIVYLSPQRFADDVQIGLPIRQPWRSLLRWLCWPSFAKSKRAHGAWCPAALSGGIVKGGRGPMALFVADVDDCESGAIDRSVAVLSPHAGAVIPTFSATVENPRHRIVLLPSRPLAVDEFDLAWVKMASTLADCGIVVDRGCRNPNRLYYACVSPSAERWAELGGARILPGSPVDVDSMLVAARADLEEEERQRARRAKPRPRLVGQRNRDKYVASAVDRARANILGAGEGGRHDALIREAYSLARFELSEEQIVDALLDAFVSAAGEPRRKEGERAIRDAIRARGGQGAA